VASGNVRLHSSIKYAAWYVFGEGLSKTTRVSTLNAPKLEHSSDFFFLAIC